MHNIDMNSRGYGRVLVRALVCGEMWSVRNVGKGRYLLGGVDGVLFLELAELGERRYGLRGAARHALDHCARESCILVFQQLQERRISIRRCIFLTV